LVNSASHQKRIEQAIISYVANIDDQLKVVLMNFIENLSKELSNILKVRIYDYRLNITQNNPYTLVPINLLGTRYFHIKRLYFDKYSRIRDKMYILFSEKIIIPVISLNTASFTTLQHWTCNPKSHALPSPDENSVYILQKGEFSLLNFLYYYTEYLKSLKVEEKYMDILARDILFLLTSTPLPTIKNRVEDFLRLLPYLSIYGSDISGVEAIGITRCLLKIDRNFINNKNVKKVSIQSKLWGEMPMVKLKTDIVSISLSASKPNVIRDELIYIPELYFDTLIEICEKISQTFIFVDAVIMSLYTLAKIPSNINESLRLFNILALPLSIYTDEHEIILNILDLVLADMYINHVASMVLRNELLQPKIELRISIGELQSKVLSIIRDLQLKLINGKTPLIKMPERHETHQDLLSYIYMYFNWLLENDAYDISLTITVYPPYILLPLLGYSIRKGLRYEDFEYIGKIVSNVLSEKPPKSGTQIPTSSLYRLRDELTRVLSNTDYEDIMSLLRDILFSWKIYSSRVRHFNQYTNRYVRPGNQRRGF